MSTDLSGLEVVVVDCQTTGANPSRGNLIELAWGVVSAASPEPYSISCFTVRLPVGRAVPGRISSITGITDADLLSGINPAEAWWLFQASLKEPIEGWRTTVAHYSRFEELWLRDLQRKAGSEGQPSLDIVCTREIARRLHPGLPRKGLHALSGFLGRTMPELKRAGDHAGATAFVWAELVRQLEVEGVNSMEKLREWLAEPPPKTDGSRTYSLPRETRLSLPDLPGVYRFIGADGRILYVGKATSLKTRVSSYFTKRKADEKTLELVTQVRDVHTTPCGSPLESALLECRLIRRLKPPYNRAMKAGDEGLWFCSDDRRSWGNSPSPDRLVGPFVTRETHDRLLFLLDLSSGKHPFSSDEITELFYLQRDTFEPGALEDGVSMLRDKIREREAALSWQHVLRYGCDLWLEMLERRESLNEEEDGEEMPAGEEEEPAERLLSPEDVCSRLMWTVADAALQERRFRWFRLLAWSTISWVPPTDASGGNRFVVIRNGGVARSGSGAPGSAVPPPVIRHVPVLTRSGYELLRVLTGELRRVSAAGTEVEITLPTDRILRGDPLQRLLRMI